MTTRSSLLNIFLILAHHPDIVNRIQEEIDTIIGDKKPKIRDRLDMPYTEAVVLEDFRYVSQIPISTFRISNADIHVNGYTIPKGTQIFANQWFYHHDPKVWEDPWSFKPERFLDSEGRLLSAEHPVRKRLQPFGIGIRICPGETFARSRVFLFIVTLLQRFDLDHPVNEPLPSCDPRNNVKGVVRQPPPYKLRLNARKRT